MKTADRLQKTATIPGDRSDTFAEPVRHNGYWFSAAPNPLEAPSLSDDAIARRAYAKYVARGRLDGFDRDDWAAAKRELIAEVFG